MPRKTSHAATAVKSETVKPKPEASPPADNHREFHRYAFRGRANAVVFPKDRDKGVAEEWEVVTTDLSRGGVSIMHRKPLAPGQQLMLVLNNAKRFVEVCWTCQVWQGLYAAGCRFLDEPAPGMMDYLMAADER